MPDLSRHPGLAGFGEAAREMAEMFESKHHRTLFGPSDELEKCCDAMNGIGAIAALALQGLARAEKTGNAECADTFRTILEEAWWTRSDLAHVDRLITGDFRWPVDGVDGQVFQVILHGKRKEKHPEFALMAALKASHRKWKERWT